jgi:hypothetical protein
MWVQVINSCSAAGLIAPSGCVPAAYSHRTGGIYKNILSVTPETGLIAVGYAGSDASTAYGW